MKGFSERLPWQAAAAVAALSLVLLAACTGGGGGRAEGGASVDVALEELKVVPSTIAVPVGEPATLQVTNRGAVPHAFAVDVAGEMFETPLLEPGDSHALVLPPLDPGSYSAWCTIAGHKEAGMTALVVAQADGQAAGHAAGGSHGMTAEQMAQEHQRSTLAFPAQTEGLGGQVLEPTMAEGVKVFTLVAKQVRWEVAPGQFVDAFGYNGVVPGPQIRVSRGDRVRIVVENELPQPTSLHLHGVTLPNPMDGVPYITQDPIMPAGYFEYEFEVVDPPGTYLYHSHFNSTEQVGMGLFGSFIVEPDEETWDVEYTQLISDGPLGFAINGKGFPATQPLTAKLGQVVLIRLANIGQLLHPFHLHGYHFTVVNRDGEQLESPYVVDTLVIGPGERYDVLVDARYPGAWAFHCHILSHVEGPGGMFGMVTALIVE